MRPDVDIDFAARLSITEASKGDWPYFSQWHYRSPHVCAVRFGTLLWHAQEPIAICLFTAAPLSLARRNDFFRETHPELTSPGPYTSERVAHLNAHLVSLSRIVTAPAYRGAGITTDFVRRSCELAPWPWIESCAAMGRFSRFLTHAGFQHIGTCGKHSHARNTIYTRRCTDQTEQKSRGHRPEYFIRDNRASLDKTP